MTSSRRETMCTAAAGLLASARTRAGLLIVVTLGLGAPTALAQTGDDTPAAAAPQTTDPAALTLEQLLTIEVESVFGASRSLQKITAAPAAVTVVTSVEIARYGWRTLADVLRNVRGFYVTNDRIYSYVGARGFLRPGDYNTRVLVMLDGRRLNDNVFDQAPFEEEFQVDLSTVDRIEVIRGPSSSLYGSSAFFGVINVVTKPATSGATGNVTVGIGSLGHGEASFSSRHQFTNGLGLVVNGTGLSQGGNKRLYYPEYDSPDTNDGIASGLDYVRRESVFARADYEGLVLTGGYNSRTRGFPTGAYDAVFNRDAWVSDTHTMFDASWTRALGAWTGVFGGAYDHYDFTGSYPYDWESGTTLRPVEYRDRAEGSWVTAEARVSRRVHARHTVTAGIEYRFNRRQDQFSYLRNPYEPLWSDGRRSHDAGAYVQDEFRVHERLLLNAGLRQDHYAAFDDPLKPRFAAIYNPHRNTTVKMMYGSAFRAPTVYESYYEIPGLQKARPGLRPEEIRTVETQVEQYVGRRLRFSGGAFRYSIENLVDFATDDADGMVYFGNRSSARATGFELEGEAKWPSGLQARLSYTYANAHDGESLQTLSNSPRHITQALFSMPLRSGVFASVDMQAVSSRLSRERLRVPGYLHPNLTITSPVARRWRATLTIGNLTNEHHGDPVGDDFVQQTVAQNGRTARLYVTRAF